MEGLTKDNLAHIDRLGLCHRRDDKCAVCGKVFYRTVDHVYKHSRWGRDLYECSWTCYRAMERKIEASGGKHSRKQKEWSPQDERPDVVFKPVDRVAYCKDKIAFYEQRYKKARSWMQRKAAKNSIRVWEDKLREAEEVKRNADKRAQA